MQSGINYFLTNYTNVDLNTFRVFYTFDSSGSGAIIPSLSPAQSLYSGTVQNYNPSFWSYSGSGYFTGSQYININNANSGIFSGPNLSFVAICQKNNNNNNVLFSNADTGNVGTSFAYRGFTFGLNSTNKLYFEYYGQNGIEIFTLPTILAEKNSLSVVLGEDTVTLGQYDFFNSQLNSETFPINSNYIFNGDVWSIGNNPTAPSFNPSCGFSGSLDAFMVFNTSLSNADIEYINSGVVTTVVQNPLISGTIQTVQVTGQQTGLVPFYSGVSGFSVAETGVYTDSFGNTYTGITTPTPLSGVIYGSGIVFLTGVVNTTIVTGQETLLTVNWPYITSFGMDYTNYIFPVDITDTNSCFFLSGDYISLGKSVFGLNSIYNKIKNTFTSNYESGTIYYLNAVAQSSGYITESNSIYDLTESLQYDYNLNSNFQINSTGFYDIDDNNTYDYVLLNNQVVYTGFNHPSGGGNLQITGLTASGLVFFNGQRLYPSDNYFLSGGNYYLGNSGLYDGNTGNLMLVNILAPFIEKSGSSPAIYAGFKFIPKQTLLWLNGIRQSYLVSYLEGSNVDRLNLSGSFVYSNNIIYNNSDTFFD